MTMSEPWLPPEWAAQQCVMLTWPHAGGDWGVELQETERCFVRMARAIGERQTVVISCHDGRHREHVRALLGDDPAFVLGIAPSNDVWVRDHGPITVIRDGRGELLDFTFNGWGGKYPSGLDNRVTTKLVAQRLLPGLVHRPVDAVLEGGSLETDGQGTLLTTSRCLLDPRRNGTVDRRQVEAWFAEWFGCNHVLWLNHGHLEGDDTDGHVDMLARFAPSDRILYTACDDPGDSHYQDLQAMAAELDALRTRDGNPYTLIPLPWPPARQDADGARLPLSYANFLVINGAVLVPVYDVASDNSALDRIADAFPGRDIVPVPALPLVRQHGSVHCASMQIPVTGA